MKITTLAMFVKDDKVLLGMKKRGFGMGKWNGYGGKLMEGETAKSAAVREIEEECGVKVSEENLIELGEIDFFFEDKPEFNQRVFIYRINEWEGEPVESEEMRPEWFSFSEIPYESMWIDDPHWYPYFLRSERFVGTIRFIDEGKRITHVDIKPN